MARKIIIALVLFAILGMAIAGPSADAPESSGASSASGPTTGSTGSSEESSGESTGFAEAAPAGGPVPDGTFPDVETTGDAASEQPKKNGGSALEVTTVTASVAVAGFSLFYF